MSSATPIPCEGAKLITCIVPSGDGLKLVERLNDTFGLNGINVTAGRGASQRSGTIADEVDFVTVTVSAGTADAVFEFIYYTVVIETTPHRLMFQIALDAATNYTLPEVPGPDIKR